MTNDPNQNPGVPGAGGGSEGSRASETPTREVSEAGSPQPAHNGQAPAATEPLVSEREPEQPEPEPETPTEAVQADEPAEAYALAGEELEALAAKAAKADEYLSLAQRTQADFENYRKRSMREAAAAQERGAVKLAKALLPAVDNLERALEHAPEDADDGFVSGIKHVHTDVVSALQKAGIERFSPEGEAFDPTLHEAVAQQPIEGTEPGTVVEVFQRGYRLGETVVRPARVVVAG